MIKKFGIQAWTVRDLMPKDDAATTAKTFKQLSEFGYSELQTISLNIPAEEYAALAKENGISIIGTHLPFDDMVADPEKWMEIHSILGSKCIGIGGMPGPARESKDELLKFCETANKFGEIISKQGFKFTYHNHSFEFKKIDGTNTMMDLLVANLDPVTTSFCLDTYWVQHGGASVADMIERLSGRIDILHLKDMGACGGENKNIPYITEVGNGNIDFAKIVPLAEKTGVKSFVVEQDSNWVVSPFDSIKASYDHIKGLGLIK